jgi:Carbohydrate binding module (family 35)
VSSSFAIASPARSIVVIPSVTLTAGANTVVFSRQASNDSVVNLDKVTAVSGDPNVTTTAPSTTTTVVTTLPPTTVNCASQAWPSYEAECAATLGTISVENNGAASGGKELGGWDYSGRATFTVNAPAAGTYQMQIRAVAPYGPATRTVTINGVAQTFSVATTSRSTVTVSVVLTAGSNTIVFSRGAGNDNVANLDKVSFN